MSVEVLNFGCRLNLAEGEAARVAAGGTGAVTIVNTCAVTNEAVRQGRQAIRRARRDRPHARILATGCATQLEPARFAAMPEVDGVLDNRAKLQREAYRGLPVPTLARAPVVTGDGHARAFIEVQTGCDHSCTFCIITHARGASESFPLRSIVDAAQAAVDRGQREVVLTGVDATSYTGGLAPLVESVLAHVPDLPRLRLSSLDPVAVDDHLVDLLTGEPRLMPHVHLSLQSGDDLILKRMKRRHGRAQAIDLVARLKARRDMSIGADLIAGFPTEDDEMFANSLDLLDACDIVFAHVFPFSPRTGTPAARMPQVAPAVARARAARLRQAAARRRVIWLDSLLGTTQKLLVERDGTSGHAPNFAAITVAPLAPSQVIPVRITGRDGERLTGTTL